METLLSEELLRIKEIMLVKEASGDPKKALAEFLAKLIESMFKKGGTVDEVAKSLKGDDVELINILKKIKNPNIGPKNLNDIELIKLFTALDPRKLAKTLYTTGTLHSDLDTTLLRLAKSLKSAEDYNKLLDGWKKASETGWGKFPTGGVPEGLKPIYKEYYSLIKSNLNTKINKENPELAAKIGLGENVKKSVNNLLNRLGTKNLNLLKGAYLNLLKKQEQIESELAYEFAKLNNDYISKGGNVNYEPYAKRITQLAMGAKKDYDNNIKNFLDKQLDDSGLPYDVTSELKSTESFKYFNDVIMSNPGKWKELDAPVKRYMMLFNPKRFFKKMEEGLTGVPSTPAEQWQRLFNMVLQMSPYSNTEIVERLAQKNMMWLWIVKLFLGGALVSFGLIPAANGLFSLIRGELAELANLAGFASGRETALFPAYGEGGSEEGDFYDYFVPAFKAAIPDSLLSVVGFSSLIDEIIEGIIKANRYGGGTADLGLLEEIAKAGEAILRGEEPQISNDLKIRLQPEIHKIVQTKYPEIPEERLGQIRLGPDLKVRFVGKFRGKNVVWDVIMEGDKIFLVNEQGQKGELNRLWNK